MGLIYSNGSREIKMRDLWLHIIWINQKKEPKSYGLRYFFHFIFLRMVLNRGLLAPVFF